MMICPKTCEKIKYHIQMQSILNSKGILGDFDMMFLISSLTILQKFSFILFSSRFLPWAIDQLASRYQRLNHCNVCTFVLFHTCSVYQRKLYFAISNLSYYYCGRCSLHISCYKLIIDKLINVLIIRKYKHCCNGSMSCAVYIYL